MGLGSALDSCAARGGACASFLLFGLTILPALAVSGTSLFYLKPMRLLGFSGGVMSSATGDVRAGSLSEYSSFKLRNSRTWGSLICSSWVTASCGFGFAPLVNIAALFFERAVRSYNWDSICRLSWHTDQPQFRVRHARAPFGRALFSTRSL